VGTAYGAAVGGAAEPTEPSHARAILGEFVEVHPHRRIAFAMRERHVVGLETPDHTGLGELGRVRHPTAGGKPKCATVRRAAGGLAAFLSPRIDRTNLTTSH
jgi:hypothetical protein